MSGSLDPVNAYRRAHAAALAEAALAVVREATMLAGVQAVRDLTAGDPGGASAEAAS